jgi:predicted transcriptional regulator
MAAEDTQMEPFTIRLPRATKRYVAQVAAQLDVSQQSIVTEALRMHRLYLERAGIIEEGKWTA